MGKAIGYFIFLSPWDHIDLKISKHIFLAHCISNSVVINSNIKY